MVIQGCKYGFLLIGCNVYDLVMVEPDGGVPLDDDIFNMPEVEQHEMEKNDRKMMVLI